MRFKIVSTGFNSGPWVERSMRSVLEQDCPDYDVCVVDDVSSDAAPVIIEKFCEEQGWGYILNQEHRGTLYNQVHAIRMMDPRPEDVIVFVDADDRLAHDRVLSCLKEHYKDDTLLTYGSYVSEPHSPTCAPARPYPAEVIANNGYRMYARYHGILFNHLRTFRYEVFEQLDNSDFLTPQGEWLQSSPDTALMMPCLELAGSRHKFLTDILYVYNSGNPSSDWRRWPRQVDADHQVILSKMVKKWR